MKGVYRLTLLLMLLALQAVATEDSPSIIGKWAVSEVFSARTPITDRSEVGTKVKITTSRVSDPLSGGDAPGKVGFREVPVDHQQQLAKKLNPQWLKAGTKGMKLIAVTSDGIDFILFMVLPDGSLVQFSEGDVVYRLIKDKN